jgi:rhodanese-related sulfurtransferase
MLPHEIDCQALQQLLALPEDQRPALLDVRFEEEHAIAALPGATLIPLPELEERADELKAFAGKQVVVYCHHGVRSLSGAGFLRMQGFEATSLRGGIDAWAAEIDPALQRY